MLGKFTIPEHIILKENSLSLNSDASLYADKFSVEEGWGTHWDPLGYGGNFGVSSRAPRVCRPDLVNRRLGKFNKQ